MRTADAEKKKKLRVLYILNDLHQFTDKGTLSHTALELPVELEKAGIEVKVFHPFFSELRHSGLSYQELDMNFQVVLGERSYSGNFVKALFPSGLESILVKNEGLCAHRQGMLEKPEDDPVHLERLSFFAHSVFAYMRLSGWIPDILHCCGWETGLVPAIQKKIFQEDPLFSCVSSLFTLHHFYQQGHFDVSHFSRTGLPWSCFNLHELEYWGKFSFIKGGIVYADGVAVLGETRTDPYLQPKASFGLNGALQKRKETFWALHGGMDHESWNPSEDRALKVPYSFEKREGKAENKMLFMKENGLTINPSCPLVAIVGDLNAYNRQGDNLERILEILCNLEAGYAVAGRKNRLLIEKFRSEKSKQYLESHFNGRWMCMEDDGEENLRRILGCANILLMPTPHKALPFLPLYALKYGTVPVVSKLFGGTDILENFNRKTGEGAGFFYEDSTLLSMIGRLISGINALYYEGLEETLMKNMAQLRINWENGLAKLLKVYKNISKKSH